jgi:type I restriction enzyme S subunit
MKQRYQIYKESGIEWLGEVPESWMVLVLGRVSNIQGGYAFDSTNFCDEGAPIVQMSNLKRGIIDLSEAKRYPEELCPLEFALTEGDVLIGMSGSIGDTGSLGNYAVVQQCDKPCFLNQRVGKFKRSTQISSDFVKYLIQSPLFFDQVQLSVTGTAQFNISPSQLNKIWLGLPSVNEQQVITVFLDSETTRIDALIQKKERLIELLKEKRIALISHAVTKGLYPNVPMKDSGIEWLGEVPEHWIHVVLGRVCKIQGGYAFDSSNFVDEGCPIVQMSNLKRGVLDLSEAKKYPYELCPCEVELEEGDNLIGMSGSIGDTGSLGNYAIVKKNDLPCYLNQRVGKLDISSKLYRGFVYYLVQSTLFFEQVQLSVTGTAQFNISPSQLGDIWITLPPTTEQNDISIYLDNETSKIETLIGRVENSITLLREYRSSLINSAVTGKIDLRDAL